MIIIYKMNNKNEELFNRILNNNRNKRDLGINLKEKKKKNLRQKVDFIKTKNTLILNIEGEKPLIIYKKSPLKKRKLEIQKNNYMSDGGIQKKNKRFFNMITNYSSKKETKNQIIKENNSSKNLKNKRYKSFSFTNKKIKKKKNNFFENEIKESNLIKNKSKGDFKYNLFLKKQKINSEKKELFKQKINININQHLETIKSKKNNTKNNLINNLINASQNYEQLTKNQIQKFFFMGKKLQYLQANNIDLSKSESNLEILKENDEEKNVDKNQKKNENKIIIKRKSDIDKNNSSNKKQKPIIDQFEYIKKINIIHNKSSKKNKSINIFKCYNLIKNENKNLPKSLNINTYKNNNNSLNNEIIGKEEDLFYHKKNKRKKEELKIFTEKRNSKEKKENEEKETIKSKKLYNKFKNLYKLNLENINFMNQQNIRKALNIQSQSNEHYRKRRERNDYYIGIDGSKNDSTFIEPKEYYLTLYQSKQLIINSNIDNNNDDEIKNEYIVNEEKTKKKKYKSGIVKLFIKKLKLFFQKKIFIDFYYMYFRNKYYSHYYLSFKLFIAIIKQYAFQKIYLYYISKRARANKDKNIIYLVEILSLIFKMKVFEKIYKYYQELERNLIKQNLETIIKVIKKAFLEKDFKKLKSHNKIVKKENSEIKEEINEEINEEVNEEINEEVNDEIKDEVNNELNENENFIDNNLNNIYADKLKNIIDEINNTDEDNKTFKNTEIEFDFDDIKNEIESGQIRNDTNINYINIIINNNINNALNKYDIPDEKNTNNEKFLDYEQEEKNEKDNLINNNISENKKNLKEFDELIGEIKQMKSYSECSGLVNESKGSKENNSNNEKNSPKTKSNKVNKNVNISLKKEIKVINIIKEKGNKKEEIKLNNSEENSLKLKNLIKEYNFDNYIDNITEEIIKYICKTEITDKAKLLPNKSNNNEINTISLKQNQNTSSIKNNKNNDFRYKDLSSLGIEHEIINDSKFSLDKSLIFSSSTYSIFNKTTFEKKKELNENFFFDKILPKLIKTIKGILINKYFLIFNYISAPININIKDILTSLNELNTDSIINIYKKELIKDNFDDIIQKKIILNKLNTITNEIRNKFFMESELIYDKILNKCIIDFIIELIKKEKLLYNMNENHLLSYGQKYIMKNEHNIVLSNNKKFANYICKSLLILLKTKLGKKPYELNLIDEDKIKEENEITLNNEIKKEILDNEREDNNNLKIEEVKIEFKIAENIFDILLKETAQILENIQYSRKLLNNNYNENYSKNDDIFNDDKNNDYYGDFEDDIINY